MAPTRDLSDPRLVHADVEPEAARVLDAHQRRAGRRHVARLDHLLGDDAVERRRDARERLGRARRLAGGACAFHAGHGGLRPRGRAGGARFGRAQRAGGVVELLRRGRALGVQAGDACVRRARQREGGIGRLLLGRRGGDALIGRQRGRARASRLGGEVASVEHDQHLTRTHAIARRDTDFADRRQDARHDRGGRPRLDHAAGLERVGDVGHGHRRDGDGNRRRRVGGRRLRAASSRPAAARPMTTATPPAGSEVSPRHHVVIAFPARVRAPRSR